MSEVRNKERTRESFPHTTPVANRHTPSVRKESKKKTPSMSIQWVMIQHVLLEKEIYIMKNVQWNDELQDTLVDEGMLIINLDHVSHNQDAIDQTKLHKDLLRTTLDFIHKSMDPTKFAKFCQVLAENGNMEVSETLWKSFKVAQIKGTASPGLAKVQPMEPPSVTKETTTVLRSYLKDAKDEASTLRSKVIEMEQDHNVMAHMVHKAMEYEDQVTVKLGTLQDTKDVLQSQLSQRDRGLDLWRKKERDYATELASLQKRMDEMSRQIRVKDAETDRLRLKAEKQQETIDILQAQVNARKRNRGPMDITERVAFQNFVEGKNKQKRKGSATTSLSSKPPAKLPTIVKVQGSPEKAGSMKSRRMNNNWSSPNKLHRLYGSENNLSLGASSYKLSKNQHPLAPIPGTPATKELHSPSVVLDSSVDTSSKVAEGMMMSDRLRRVVIRGYQSHVCFTCDKWVDPAKGAKLDLPNLQMTIPAKALKSPVNVVVSDIQNQEHLQELIEKCGLQDFFEPSLHLVLQPHGLRFQKEVYLELKNQNLSSPSKLMVFHKDIHFFEKTKWENITQECSPRSHKQNVVLTVGQFCAIQTFKILGSTLNFKASSESVIAPTMGVEQMTVVMSNVLNDQLQICDIHVFINEFDQRLVVLILPHGENETFNKDILNTYFKRGFGYLTNNKTKVAVINDEVLYFYFDNDQNCVSQGLFCIEESKTGGQMFTMSISAYNKKQHIMEERSLSNQYNNDLRMPFVLNVKRQFSESTEQELCSIDLRVAKISMQGREDTRADFDRADLNAVYNSMLKKVTTTVDIRHLMKDMKKEEVFTLEEIEQIQSQKVPYNRAKIFMEKLAEKGAKGLAAFCKSLEGKYPAILEDVKNAFIFPEFA